VLQAQQCLVRTVCVPIRTTAGASKWGERYVERLAADMHAGIRDERVVGGDVLDAREIQLVLRAKAGLNMIGQHFVEEIAREYSMHLPRRRAQFSRKMYTSFCSRANVFSTFFSALQPLCTNSSFWVIQPFAMVGTHAEPVDVRLHLMCNQRAEKRHELRPEMASAAITAYEHGVSFSSDLFCLVFV
jgi:hypothetical protein